MAIVVRPVSEAEFMRQVVRLAGLFGWLVYHTHDSRRSQAGFPDLTLAHPGRGELVFAELKSARGRVRPEQQAWLEALRAAGQRAYLWRPGDWPEIEEVLRG